jgi:hypothetical protein
VVVEKCHSVDVTVINALNTKLNPICHLLALLGAHPILRVSRIRVKVVACHNYEGSYIIWIAD